jgi:hypothetical protein
MSTVRRATSGYLSTPERSSAAFQGGRAADITIGFARARTTRRTSREKPATSGEWPGGVSPPGSLRTGRDSLPSSGSHGSASKGWGELPVGE